ncbi:MAG: hypothetical protein IJS82_00325 [Paludibacteraceae bacterium]|nr:hypothetical protein [Paludibacteraceae bacterium]
MILMIILFVLMLFALWLGSRHGGLALGAVSGLGLAVMVFCFGLKPGSPPTDVIYIIIAAITCAGIMQAADGMEWLIQLAEKLFLCSIFKFYLHISKKMCNFAAF